MNDVSPVQTGIRYGVISAFFSILINYLTYFLGLMTNDSASTIISVLSLIPPVVLVVLAIKNHRDAKQGGHITFGKAFSVGLVTTLVAAVLGAIFVYILYAFVAPNLLAELGNTEDTPVTMSVNGLLGGVGFGAAVALIASFIFKRE